MGNKLGKGLAQVVQRAKYAAIVVIGAAALVQTASAQVVDTKHNLSATAPGANTPGSTRVNYMTGDGATTQVCVFCHTPHGAASAEAPLWQRTLATATSYSTYGSVNASTSMDAEQGAGVSVGSISLACLSCHDGTQAMNTMSNTPGSGNLATGKAAGDWAANGRNTDGKLTGIANLLGDNKSLQNDHPIGIRYAGGFTYSSSATTVANTAFADKEFRTVNQASINSAPVWFVEPKSGASANSARDKNDIQLYTRTIAAGNYQPYVECASCHDPHSSAELFMRVPVAGSEICLTCHIK
ncbi:cytochrome c3 family protein [Noviherbaspirillum sp. ST9]|uniref:cytochrome c3 family protein n=1 Tax=Noviherbaspirillum sp. ST9 TaxID=3401606 RepID=UPI003B5871EB